MSFNNSKISSEVKSSVFPDAAALVGAPFSEVAKTGV
jgi:hypothetical protein